MARWVVKVAVYVAAKGAMDARAGFVPLIGFMGGSSGTDPATA